MKDVDPLVAQLRAIRLERGLSLSAVAEAMGRGPKARSSVLGWESGRCEPGVGSLREWAAALGYEPVLSFGVTRAGGS